MKDGPKWLLQPEVKYDDRRDTSSKPTPEQLENLEKYIKEVERELGKHKP